MSVRLLAALALGAAVLAAPAAQAKPPVCKQVTDAQGDAHVGGDMNTTGQGSYQALDILSADVATGANNVVGALRLKTTKPDQTLVTGRTYYLRWTVKGITQGFTYNVFAVNNEHEFLFNAGTEGNNFNRVVTGNVDDKTGTISWVVPRKFAFLPKKALLSNLTAEARYAVNDEPPVLLGKQRVSVSADVGKTTGAYLDRTPTCLKGV